MTPDSRTRRRGSLKKRLLAWFLLVALVPLTVVSTVSYYTAKESLRDAASDLLSATVDERAAFINNWFHYRLIDLESQATNIGNVRFLVELHDAFAASGKPLEEFVKGYSWAAIVNERGEDLKMFRKLYTTCEYRLLRVGRSSGKVDSLGS